MSPFYCESLLTLLIKCRNSTVDFLDVDACIEGGDSEVTFARSAKSGVGDDS